MDQPLILESQVSMIRPEFPWPWVLVTLFLTLLVIIFICLWVSEAIKTCPEAQVCFGNFGVEAGFDANPISACGKNRTSPCIFSKGTLVDAINECNNLHSICNTFTFNPNTATMKIINTNSVFESLHSSLYVRQ